MLGKLLKYEIPAMGRKLLPLYAAWAVTAILLGIAAQTANTKSEFAMVITVLLYVSVATAIMVMAAIMIVQRYRNSMLGDEGYFNHVLPVSVSAHIGNKLISAALWVIITIVVGLLTGLIIWLTAAVVEGFDFSIFNLDPGLLTIPKHFGLYVVEVLILMIASIVKTIMQIYAAITIGHQAANRTTLASIGAYIGIMVFESMIGRLFISISPVFDNLAYDTDGMVNFTLIFIPTLLATMAFSAIYFFICKYLMEKRLNLA